MYLMVTLGACTVMIVGMTVQRHVSLGGTSRGVREEVPTLGNEPDTRYDDVAVWRCGGVAVWRCLRGTVPDEWTNDASPAVGSVTMGLRGR
jgi:hypothetical protein